MANHAKNLKRIFTTHEFVHFQIFVRKTSKNSYWKILKKWNPKRGIIIDRVYSGNKNLERIIASICIYSFTGITMDFSGSRARWRFRKLAYIFVQCGTYPLILAYAISNWHHNIAQLTLTIYTQNVNFLVTAVSSQAMLLVYFSRNCARPKKITDKD